MLETVVRHQRRALVGVKLEGNMPPASWECNPLTKHKRGRLKEPAASMVIKNLRARLEEQLTREGDDLLVLVPRKWSAGWRRQSSAAHVLKLDLQIGGSLVDPPVETRGPDPGVIRHCWVGVSAEVLVGDHGLPLANAIGQVREKAVAGARMEVAKAVVVESKLSVDRLISRKGVFQEDVRRRAAVV